MAEKIERFFVPTKPTLIEGFRAFRAYLEKVAEREGKTLDPAWYDDGPERLPHLYEDQPEVLAALKKDEPPPQDTRPQER